MGEAVRAMTEAEYLQWEPLQELRHEFDGRRAHAMTGGTLAHETIQGNLKFELVGRLRGRPCQAFGPTARVPTTRGRYRYPDAVVTCAPVDLAGRDVPEPVVLFEVASASTALLDRSEKLVEYRSIPSLVRYVMLEQDGPVLTSIARMDDHWRIDVLRPGEVLDLPEIGVALPVDALYAGLEFRPREGAAQESEP